FHVTGVQTCALPILGLACCMLILLYVKDEASFDRFHENLAQLHRVKVTMTNGDGQTTIGSTNAIHGPTFKEENPEIREVVRAQRDRKSTRLNSSHVK